MITLNGELIKPTRFPDGTSQVWRVEGINPDTNRIIWEFENEGELMHLAQLRTLLEGTRVRLCMPFLPYGRQDKEVSNQTTFALRCFAEIIKGMNFDKITTLDAHSGLFLDLAGAVNTIPRPQIGEAISACSPDVLAFPDAGASKRYSSLFKLPSIIGYKTRNQKTGAVAYNSVEGANVENKRVLIVDDICDGGATFVLFASQLQKLGAKEINLYTTHGIYSKGLNVLFEAGISRIFNRKGQIK